MALGADVHAEMLARRGQIVLGAAVAAAYGCAVGAGMDRGVHNGPLSTWRHSTAFVSITTTEGSLAFPERPRTRERRATSTGSDLDVPLAFAQIRRGG
jgi:hypothetical protein